MEVYEDIYDNNELYHHGIKGMRWGIRRFQNKDGSLTDAGKRRSRSLGQVVHDHKVKKKRVEALKKARATKAANKEAAEKAAKKAERRQKLIEKGRLSPKKMTDEELKAALARKENEKKYNDAMLATSTGKRAINKLWNDGIVPGAAEGAKKVVSNLVDKKLSDVLGLNTKEAKSAYQILKEDAEMAKWRKQKFQDERDLAEATKRYKDHLEDEKKAKQNKEAQEKTANYQRDRDYEYEQNQRKGNYKDNINVDGAEVVGEGTSTSEYKNQHGSLGSNKKPDDYYDPIDVEGTWVDDHGDTPVSNLPSTTVNSGQSYVAGLLENKD